MRAAGRVHSGTSLRLMCTLALPLVALLLPHTALASASDDFAACDGFTKPGGSVDGMGSQSRLPTAQEFGAPLLADMTACNDALVSPKLLPQQNLRRVHLLRARAGAYLRNGDLAAAFADLDRAEAAAGQLKDDPLFERSLGTSLRLLRALALDRSGQSDHAVAMVEDAANLRPWSIEIQQVLSYLLLHRPGAAATGTMLFGRHRQLDPQFDQYAARAFAAEGNFTALARLASPLSPIPADSAAQAHGKAVGALLLGDVDRAIVHAYAQAAIDNHEAARRELDLVDAWLERGKSGTTGDAGSATEPTAIKELLNKFIANAELSAKRVRARLALDEHRMTDAEALVHGATFASDAISADLNLKLAAAGLAPAAVGWPEWHSTDEDMQTAQRQALFHEAVRDALLEPETLIPMASTSDPSRMWARPWWGRHFRWAPACSRERPRQTVLSTHFGRTDPSRSASMATRSHRRPFAKLPCCTQPQQPWQPASRPSSWPSEPTITGCWRPANTDR